MVITSQCVKSHFKVALKRVLPLDYKMHLTGKQKTSDNNKKGDETSSTIVATDPLWRNKYRHRKTGTCG